MQCMVNLFLTVKERKKRVWTKKSHQHHFRSIIHQKLFKGAFIRYTQPSNLPMELSFFLSCCLVLFSFFSIPSPPFFSFFFLLLSLSLFTKLQQTITDTQPTDPPITYNNQQPYRGTPLTHILLRTICLPWNKHQSPQECPPTAPSPPPFNSIASISVSLIHSTFHTHPFPFNKTLSRVQMMEDKGGKYKDE